MIVQCERCSARYRLEDTKITGRGARITCPRCRHVFVVYPDGINPAPTVDTAPAAPEAVAPEAPVARRSAEGLDFATVGIASWKVKVKIGLVYDFSDIKTLKKYIQDGRVTAEDAISHDGASWTVIGDIPQLDAWFVKVYHDAQARLEAARAENFSEDEPTTIVGAGGLGASLAAEALRQGREPRLPPSPVAKGAPKPTPTGNRFVDPFETARNARPARTPEPAQQAPARRSLLPLAAIIVFGAALGAGGWWWSQRDQAMREAAKAAEAQADVAEAADLAARQQAAKERVQDKVKQTLESGGQPLPPIEDEDEVLIPVGPRGSSGSTGQASYAGNVTPAVPTDDATTVRPLTAADHAAAGDTSAQSGNWSGAVEAYSQAVALSPNSGDYRARLGKALYFRADHGAAERELKNASRLGATDPEVSKYLGYIAKAQGDLAGANGYFNEYLSGNPPDADAIRREMGGG